MAQVTECFKQENNLLERIGWLIKLRWIAVVGVAIAVYFVSKILAISLPVFSIYSIVVILLICNALFAFFLARITNVSSKGNMPANRLANIQISLDLSCLAILIHFSGGVENPFIFYFIFHMIIASILLTARASFLQATYAIGLFIFIVYSEYFGFLPHYFLFGDPLYTLHDKTIYVFGVSFAFLSTLYIAVYMATSISSRLRRREVSLKEVNQLLVEKDRIKSEYVIRVTHDIKGHLAAIHSCIEPVTAGIIGALNEKQANLLHRADARVGKLLFFLKALLEITHIKLNEKVKMEHFSFKDMLTDIIEDVSSKAKDKNISLNCIMKPGVNVIMGHRGQLQEAIGNILANSIKYTPCNGSVDVTVGDKGNSIQVKIKDTGIGIPKSDLPRVFDEFYRASNAKAVEKDGTGLGLAIVRQIIKRHKGKVWVESELGEGSEFNIILPK